jgi:hypothetical protein
MHEVANPAGRLITFRIRQPVADDNGAQASLDLRSQIVAHPDAVIVVTDLCEARTFSPETTDRFVALMKSDNPKLFRSAVLLGMDAAILGLQVVRMVKEAANPARRAFFDADELRSWLEPDCSEEERSALEAFFR